MFRILASAGALTVVSNLVIAQDMKPLPQFINDSYVPVYDCPSADVLPVLKSYLAAPDLSLEQKYQLTTRKTHVLVCVAQYNEAQNLLRRLLADEAADRSARYYVNAIYQYAFVYDVQENSEKCNYYRLAKDNSREQFADIYTSASLAHITDCSKDMTLDEKVVQLYELVESITMQNDRAAMAHAHNRIGLFYGDVGAVILASQQYEKAYEIGKEIYTNENLVSILTSVMTTLLLSENYERAKMFLDEFEQVAAKAESVATQFYFRYSQSSYYIAVGDYQNLAKTLEIWGEQLEGNSTKVFEGLFRWHSAELCLHKKDTACLEDFLAKEALASENYMSTIGISKEYLLFIVKVHLFLQDFEQSELALKEYTDKIAFLVRELRSNSRNIGTLNLQNKIVNLESKIKRQEVMRKYILSAAIVVIVIFAGIFAWFLRQKHLRAQSIDSATGLLNSAAVIAKISRLSAPGQNRTNALAIFDIANFTEVNLIVGSGKSDYVLNKLANTFRNITRSSDLLGRFGPGQFILCLADIEEDAAQAFFERAKDALSNTFRDDHNGDPISVDSSMSIYYESETFTDINEILDNMLLSLSMKSDS